MSNELKLREALRWALEWIDSVPDDVQLPAMPGFDREYVNGLLESTPPAASGQQEVPTQEKLRETIADLVRAAEDCMQMPKPFRAGNRRKEASEELDRVVAAIYAAHPAPAQQESGWQPEYAFQVAQRVYSETRHDAAPEPQILLTGTEILRVAELLNYRAPAPAALTDDEIIVQWLEFDTWPRMHGQTIIKFARAILATASAAPANK